MTVAIERLLDPLTRDAQNNGEGQIGARLAPVAAQRATAVPERGAALPKYRMPKGELAVL